MVSSVGDHQVIDVANLLRENGHEPIEIYSEEIPLRSTLALKLGGTSGWSGSWTLPQADAAMEVGEATAIWWRKPGEYFGLPAEMPLQEREFARGEIDHVWRAFWGLQDSYWMSRPEAMRQASLKIDQLQRAVQLGFEVPPSLITNDPDEVRAFYEANGRSIIFKVLTDPMLGAVRMAGKYPQEDLGEIRETLTTRIGSKELESLEGVRVCPALFQAYVPKRSEFRVTIIGDDAFTAEIDSQAEAGTATDWRTWRGIHEISYRVAQLPPDVEERCFKLVRSYGLNFSAIDIICTPEERYVFLESNPNGQYGWIEHRVPELRMTEAIAACLLRGGDG